MTPRHPIARTWVQAGAGLNYVRRPTPPGEWDMNMTQRRNLLKTCYGYEFKPPIVVMTIDGRRLVLIDYADRVNIEMEHPKYWTSEQAFDRPPLYDVSLITILTRYGPYKNYGCETYMQGELDEHWATSPLLPRKKRCPALRKMFETYGGQKVVTKLAEILRTSTGLIKTVYEEGIWL